MQDFSEYNFELNLMFNNIGISRNLILVRKGLNYKRRFDLENNITCNIWIELSLGTNKSLMIMGGYRQWTLPKSLDIENNKNKNIKQCKRFKITLDNWEKCLAENKDCIIMTDDNIDSSIEANHNKIYKIKNLEQMLLEHIDKHGIVTHNHKFTRFERHVKPSTLGHVYSNCPHKLTNVETIQNLFSDHSLLFTRYTTKENMYKPKFINIRNFKLLTRNKILGYLNNSKELESVFNHTDPNIVASIIQVELNSIIELIAPVKKVQYKKNYKPYFNEEIINNLKQSHIYLEEAIK